MTIDLLAATQRTAVAAVTVLLVAGCSAASVESSATPSAEPSASASPLPIEPTRPEAVWTADIGSESWSQPAALGELVVVGANDGVLRAFDAASGTAAWEVATDGALRGGIAASDGVAYAVSDDGTLYAVDATGNEVWATVIGAAAGERSAYDNYGSRPAVGDGTVFAATYSGTVAAVDAATGDVTWSVDIGSAVETGLALGEERLHVSTMSGDHFALNIADGSIAWELPTGDEATTTPAIIGDTVLIGSRSTRLYARDEATGEKVWTVGFGSSWVQSGAVPIDDTTFAIGSSDYRAVRALDVNTSGDVWLAQVIGWPWAVPAVGDGVVYASEVRLDYQLPWDSALSAFDGATGTLLWTAPAGEALEWAPDGYGAYGNGAGPTVVGDMVVVPGLDGVVRAFAR